MKRKTSKRGGGKSVSKKKKSNIDTPNFLTSSQIDLTKHKKDVDQFCVDSEDDIDFVESLIEENI